MGNKKFLGAMLSKESQTVLDLPVQGGGFADLPYYEHCLVVTYKRDGTPVAHPVWPGYDGDRVFLWTEVEAFKAKRLRRNPDALIAPCSFRGKPLGPPIAAHGRILETDAERAHAEATIRAQWGSKRKTFAAAAGLLTAVHYIELVPARPATVQQ
jgi:PPOX class probable F420-dependent enzyme